MKALSIKLPWAWLIIHGGKDIENRSWNTKFRGRFQVHASGSVDMNAYHALVRKGVKLPDIEELKKLRGGIIGSVCLIGCVERHPSFWAESVGWCFILSTPKAEPFYKCKGQLNFWEVHFPEVDERYGA